LEIDPARADEAMMWCKQNIPEGRWDYGIYEPNQGVFVVLDDDKVTLFKLMFG
jgi:hypothetical protein